MEQKKYIVRGSSFDGTTWFVNTWGRKEETISEDCIFTETVAKYLANFSNNRYAKKLNFRHWIEEVEENDTDQN